MFRLDTDFKDYYDALTDCESNIVYRRKREIFRNRGEELLYLKNNGIKTVDFGPFRRLSNYGNKFIVYTNPALHEFMGKHIYTSEDIANCYSNCAVSEFLEASNGYTIKYLQVGERRFRMMFHNPEYMTRLHEGKLVALEELPRQFNYAIGLPIYSIDYMSNGTEMVAIDFNEVQRLDKIGIDKVMTADEVVLEVKKALLAYNKA